MHYEFRNVEESHQVLALVQMGTSNSWFTSQRASNESSSDMPALSGLSVNSKGDVVLEN